MKQGLFLNCICLFLLVAFSHTVLAQVEPNDPRTDLRTIGDFKYKNTFYRAHSKELKKFIAETEMTEELKIELTKQWQAIKAKKNGARIALYSGFAIGTGIFAHEALTLKDGEQLNSNTLYMGLGVWAIGGIVHLIVRPKKKHYIHFINTFNAQQTGPKIEMGQNIPGPKHFNIGIALNF